MKIAELARIVMLGGLVGWLGLSNASAQQVASAPGTSTIESITAEYDRDLLQIEKQRLDRIGRLALSQPKDKAEATLDTYFRLAIAKNLYADAEPTAKRVIASGDSKSVLGLAYLVEIVGEADKGAYDDSLANLAAVIKLKGTQAKPSAISIGTKASILDAYFQRLVHADQIEVARKAMKMIADTAEADAIRDLATRRLKQVELVGKPSPALAGVDLEGKPFQLEDAKGEVVLVVFWATWCVPNAQEMPWLDYLHATYRARGLKIVGVNLDASQQGSKGAEAVLPNVHRFLLDYNVTWPTLMNGPGDKDHAAAFSVTEIPANVLIGRDGKVRHIDLTGRKLEKAITAAIAEHR